MSFTAPRSQKSAADVIEHLAGSGTGRDKISVLQKWLSGNKGASGKELLNFLYGRIHVGHSLKDEETGAITDVSIGICTIEKAGKFLRGDGWTPLQGESIQALRHRQIGPGPARSLCPERERPLGAELVGITPTALPTRTESTIYEKTGGPKNLADPSIEPNRQRRPICQFCRKRFRTRCPTARFCSPACRLKAWRRVKRWNAEFMKRLNEHQPIVLKGCPPGLVGKK